MKKKNREIKKSINNDKTKGQRIIKRNKWKIIIILSIILIIIISISVGLYFAFKPTPYNLNTKNIKIAKISDVKKDILDKKGNNIGLYFYEENGETTNYLMWADKKGMEAEEEEKGKGPLSSHIDNPSSINTTWYAVNIANDPSQIMVDLFLYKNKEGNHEEWVYNEAFGDFFRGDGFGFNDSESNSHYVENASYSLENENDIENIHDEFNGVGIEDSFSSNPQINWSISDGTTMWFDGSEGKVMSVIHSYSTPNNQSDEESSDFNTMIISWWEEIEKGISKNN